MMDEDRFLLQVRREMCQLRRNDENVDSTVSIKNKQLLKLEKEVAEIEIEQPSVLYNSGVTRYDYDDIPIGSILHSLVFYTNKQSTLRNCSSKIYLMLSLLVTTELDMNLKTISLTFLLLRTRRPSIFIFIALSISSVSLSTSITSFSRAEC